MNTYTTISVGATVLSFLVFLGIIAWAWSKRRMGAFKEAANAPFALPDDAERIVTNSDHAGPRP